MKSRIIKPAYITKSDAENAIAGAVKKTADLHVGSLLLAICETNGIGDKRANELLDNYSEWLEYFAQQVHDGISDEILEKRLRERGMWEVFKTLVL